MAPQISDELHTELCPFQFESLVFPHVDFVFYHKSERTNRLDLAFNVNSQEQMIVLVVFERDAVPEEKELVGQATITEIHLRPLFELVFG